jgi:hypothetical protein
MWIKPSLTEAEVDAEPETKPDQDLYIAKLEEELKKQK